MKFILPLAFLVGSVAQADATCPLAQPFEVASGLSAPFHLEVDDLFVYWMDFQGNSAHLYRVRKLGGRTPQDLGAVPINDDAAYDYDVDSSWVYLMDFGDNGHPVPMNGRVTAIHKDGTGRPSASVRGTADCRAEFAQEIVAASGKLFVLTQGTTRDSRAGCMGDGEKLIERIDFDGPSTLEPQVLAIVGASARRLTANGPLVYWLEDGGVFAIRADGSGAGASVASVAPADELAVDAAQFTFYTVDGTGTFSQVGQILEDPLAGIRFDGTNLYGTVDRGAGQPANLVRAKPNGHGLTALAKAKLGATAVDEAFVYYLDPTGTRIWKTCK